MKVNDARRDLFTRKGRDVEAIPPTSDALRQHAKRSTYQAGHCWGNSLVPSPLFPCSSEWGWVKVANDMWAPLWMTIPQVSRVQEVVSRTAVHSTVQLRWDVRMIMHNRITDANEQICVSLALLTTFL